MNKFFEFVTYLLISLLSLYFITESGHNFQSVFLFLILSFSSFFLVKTASYMIFGNRNEFKKNDILIPSEYNLEDLDYIEYKIIDIVGKNYKCLSKNGQVKYIHFDDEYYWEIKKD